MLRLAIRRYSTQRRLATAARYTGYLGISAVVGVVSLAGAILIHDAFTYNDRHVHRVPVHPLALNPERGGPKNLPIARVLVGDEEDDDAKLLATKPKLVVVGGGWGVSLRYTFVFLQLTCIKGHGRPSSSLSRGLSCYGRFNRHIHPFHAPPSLSDILCFFSHKYN